MSNDAIKFELTKRIGTIKAYDNGWAKELNIVAWNGGSPKYDIRDWDPSHERMNRGITLFEDEANALCELLKKEFFHI